MTCDHTSNPNTSYVLHQDILQPEYCIDTACNHILYKSKTRYDKKYNKSFDGIKQPFILVQISNSKAKTT